MFRPEKMSFVNISVLDEHLTPVLDRLVKLGVMHVVDKEELPPIEEELEDVDVEPVKNSLDALSSRIEEMLTILSIGISVSSIPAGVSEDTIEISPFQITDKIEEELSEIEREVSPAIRRQTQAQEEIAKLEEDSYRLAALDAKDVTVEDLKEPRFLYFAFGDIPAEYYERLIGSLANVPCVLVAGEFIAGRQQILAFSLMSDREALYNALEAAYFSRTVVPEKYHGPIADVLDEIELEIWAKREEMAELHGEIRSLRQRWRDRILELHATIAANRNVIESVGKFGKIGNSYYLSGWVPHRDVRRLQKELADISDEGILIEAGAFITAQDAEHHEPKVPTKLSHPSFLRPFAGLVTNFGIPGYSDIDPTPFASIAFLAMFGIMFADVGHGGVLLLLGLFGALYPSPQFKPIRNMAVFLACCGGASIIFGFVFGSIFGMEGLVEPLWFSLKGMENPDAVKRMLGFGIFFGVGILSLGILLNIAQSFMKRNFRDAFFGQWGIFSILFYWAAALLVYLVFTKRQVSWDKILLVVTVLFLLPIILREPVSRLMGKKREHGEEAAEGIIVAGFHIYEMFMSYLANTLSYIRIAAFNMSHAGLMVASYKLTEQLGGGNFLLSLPSNIMANVFVMMLEGLIVAIQCMRLEYYEFFSKFFTGEGIEYKPMKID